MGSVERQLQPGDTYKWYKNMYTIEKLMMEVLLPPGRRLDHPAPERVSGVHPSLARVRTNNIEAQQK